MNEYVFILKNGKEIKLLADDIQVKSYLTFDYYAVYTNGNIIARFNLNFIAAVIRGDKYDK